MVNINSQKYINDKYPIDGVCERVGDLENKDKKRSEIIKLDISKGKIGNNTFGKNKILVGSLKLEGFTDLRKLIVSSHQITSLDVSDCQKLEELDCRGNQLNNLNVSGCSSLKKIDCSDNNLSELNLTTCS